MKFSMFSPECYAYFPDNINHESGVSSLVQKVLPSFPLGKNVAKRSAKTQQYVNTKNTEIQDKLGNPLLRLKLQYPYFNNLQNIQFDNGGT